MLATDAKNILGILARVLYVIDHYPPRRHLHGPCTAFYEVIAHGVHRFYRQLGPGVVIRLAAADFEAVQRRVQL
jgi:hypothetical protein